MDPLLTEMKGLAEKYNVPMSAIAINWVICKGAIPLGGARNAEQAEQVGQECNQADNQNAKAMTFKMTDAEVDSLSAKGATGTTYVPCRLSVSCLTPTVAGGSMDRICR